MRTIHVQFCYIITVKLLFGDYGSKKDKQLRVPFLTIEIKPLIALVYLYDFLTCFRCVYHALCQDT